MDFLSVSEAEALFLSLKVALSATLWTLIPAFMCAWLLARFEFRFKTLFDALIHTPLILPPVIVGYLLLLGFGPNGTLGAFLENTLGLSFAFNWQGAALAAAVMAFPLMVRAMRLSIEAGDQRLEAAARTLGAGPFRAFTTITLPLALPGIISGGLLGFARALGEFGATISFVSNIPGLTQTLPLALYNAIQSPGGEVAAFRLMMISLALAFGALLASEVMARRIKARLGGNA